MTGFCGNLANRRVDRRRLLQMGVVALGVNATLLPVESPAQSAPTARPIKLVAFGDSLTAGYLLAPGEAFPVILAKHLAARGDVIEVINAGVSGDTTSAGRDRLAWSVPPETDAVILELGANDALRGVDPAVTRANLEAMIVALKVQKVDILLAGMVAPKSFGEPYTKAFDAIFPDLALKHDLLLYPLFIAAVALKPALNLADGMHPNAKGVEVLVADILPKVEALLGRVKARRAAAEKG